LFFSDKKECESHISRIIEDDSLVTAMKIASKKQYMHKFTADKIHGAYERLLLEYGC